MHKCIFQFFAVLACLFSLFLEFYQARGRAASGVLAFYREKKWWCAGFFSFSGAYLVGGYLVVC